VLEHFLLLRVITLQGKKAAHLQAPYTSQGVTIWPALLDPAPLLPFPVTRTQSTLNKASPPTMIITVLSIRAQKSVPGIHNHIAIPPMLEGLPTTASATQNYYFLTIPTTTNG
jgi:hypothetical protein